MKLIILFLVLIILGAFLLEAEVIWDNFYNPFGADGINVRPHMQICSDGSYAVTGYYIIEDGMGGYLDWRGYVMKISSEGELLWADPDTLVFMGENESWAVIETSDGGLINCGDGYMIKRDAEGNRLWSQNLNIAPHTMCYSHNGNIILSGGTTSGDCLFREIDENGNELLNNDINLAHGASIKRIIPTSDGGYAMTGIILDEEDWRFDILVVKTNVVGDTLWTFTKGGNGNNSDNGNWILENSENNLLVLGRIRNPTTFGYLALFNLNGDNLWEEIVGNNEIWYEHFYAIDLPEDDSFLLSTAYRVYKSDYDYNIEWIAEDLLAWFQKTDDGFIFYIGGIDGVHLMKTDGNIVGIYENVISINHKNLKCYPNPFNPEITISFNITEHLEKSYINIYNSKGQRVKQYELFENSCSVVWNGIAENRRRVSSGVYFVTLNSNGKTLAYKKITMIK